jgi:hypothetical protein
MNLTELWRSAPDNIRTKHVQQIVKFAGEGTLSDDTAASREFTAFLRQVPADLLSHYMAQCLDTSFDGSGFVLQDLVNEAGRRLGFDVENGRYRGRKGANGADGIWRASGCRIVIEVKTTDVYRVRLDVLEGYRQKILSSASERADSASVLVVVGRSETGGLEAQIRGSRHAWSMRVISVEALSRLLSLREALEDPSASSRIQQLLVPREFTRLDAIIEFLFTAAEDASREEAPDVLGAGPPVGDRVSASFHELCVKRVEVSLGYRLLRRTRVRFSSADDSVRVACAVSRRYVGAGGRENFWFSFYPHQQDWLAEREQ